MHQHRAEERSPAWPFAACPLRLCRARSHNVAAGGWAGVDRTVFVILRVAGGIVLIFGETEVSWISASSCHLTARTVLTPRSPCPDLKARRTSGVGDKCCVGVSMPAEVGHCKRRCDRLSLQRCSLPFGLQSGGDIGVAGVTIASE